MSSPAQDGARSAASATVEERLAALEACEAARSLMARYADVVDDQDLSALGELLADEVVVDVGMRIEGREAVLGFFGQAFAADPTKKSHFITNLKTRSLGDGRVGVDAYFLYTAADDVQSIIGWGTYADEVVVRGGVAHFTRIALAIRRSVDVRKGWTIPAESA